MPKNARILVGSALALFFAFIAAVIVKHHLEQTERTQQVALYNTIAKQTKPLPNPHTKALQNAVEACGQTGSYMPGVELFAEAHEETIQKSAAHTWPKPCQALGARHDPRFAHVHMVVTAENCDKIEACAKAIDAFEHTSAIRGVQSPLSPWHIHGDDILSLQDTVGEYRHTLHIALLRAHFEAQATNNDGRRLEAALDVAQLGFDIIRGAPMTGGQSIDNFWNPPRSLLERKLQSGDATLKELDAIIEALSAIRARFPSFFDTIRAEIILVGAHLLDGEDIDAPVGARKHLSALVDTQGVEGVLIRRWPARVFDALLEILAFEDSSDVPWAALIAIDKKLGEGLNPVRLHTWNQFHEHLARFVRVHDNVVMLEIAARIRRHVLTTGKVPASLSALDPPPAPELLKSQGCDKPMALTARGDIHELNWCPLDTLFLKNLGAAAP